MSEVRPEPLAPAGLLQQEVLAVGVKTRLAELARFPVHDGAGREVGSVTWDGRGWLDTVSPMRRRTAGLEARLPQTLLVSDAGGPVLVLTRPEIGWDRVLLRVARPGGREVGSVAASLWRARYRLHAGGRPVGTVRRVPGRGWGRPGYVVTGLDGAELARVTPEAGRHVTELRQPLPEPLAPLVVAVALTVDTALTTYGRLG
ncbi:scramblase [Blastococcus sp. SYSU D00820]